MNQVMMKMILILTSLVLITSCSTSPTGRSQLTLMPDSQLAAMGRQSFEKMKKEKRVSRDPRVNRRIQCIAKHITAAVEKRSMRSGWEVVVFEDKAVNAFALPGKKIGVYTGLIKMAENNAQIASVMGHEVGHVLAEHGNERVSQGLLAQGGLIAASVALKDQEPRKQQLILAGLGLGAQFGVLLPFSRKHESEADEIGLMLMARAGFEPTQAAEFWRVISRKSRGGQPPEFLSTHPSHSTRIKDLDNKVPKAMRLYRAKEEKPNCPS